MTDNPQEMLRQVNNLVTKMQEEIKDEYPNVKIVQMINYRVCWRCGAQLPRFTFAFWVGKATYWCGCRESVPELTTKLQEHLDAAEKLRKLLEG